MAEIEQNSNYIQVKSGYVGIHLSIAASTLKAQTTTDGFIVFKRYPIRNKPPFPPIVDLSTWDGSEVLVSPEQYEAEVGTYATGDGRTIIVSYLNGRYMITGEADSGSGINSGQTYSFGDTIENINRGMYIKVKVGHVGFKPGFISYINEITGGVPLSSDGYIVEYYF